MNVEEATTVTTQHGAEVRNSAVLASAAGIHMNGDTAGDSPRTAPLDLPRAPSPLSAANTFLDPSITATFDPDAFLASRTSGHSLADISSELADYSKTLSDQLLDVINQNYRDFVSLGSNLKSEAHRIARLGWITGSAAGLDDASSGSGPTGTAALGTDEVRSTVLSSRDALRGVERSVQQVLLRRDEETERKNHMSFLLELHSSLRRLESLLLISNKSGQNGFHDDEEDDDDDDDDDAGYGAGHLGYDEDQWEEEERWWSDPDEEVDTKAPPSAPTLGLNTLAMVASSSRAAATQASPSPMSATSVQPTLPRPLPRRRSSTVTQRLRRRSSVRRRNSILQSPAFGGAASHGTDGPASVSLLALPLRISRSAAEHSSLLFLLARAQGRKQLGAAGDEEAHRRAANDDAALQSFLLARSDRITRVRTTLLRDLRTLLAALLQRDATGAHSLLLSARDTSSQSVRADLQDWSEVVSPAAAADPEGKREHALALLREHQAWLDMALRTYTALGAELDIGPSSDEARLEGSREAEKAVRDVFVSPWVRETIHASALRAAGPPAVPPTPATGEDQVVLHATNNDEAATTKLLRELYNRILAFASSEAREICIAAERVNAGGHRTTSASISSHHPIDIFANVLWDEIANRLMDELGGQIFFVGRTEVFHANYSVSMRFLTSFAQLAPTPSAEERFEAHPTTVTFRKRWGLNVYFQMRFREVVGRLERALEASVTNVSAQAGAPSWWTASHPWTAPLLPSTLATLQAFAEPWTASVHLAPLIPRQWRLSLQVLSRCRSEMEAVVEKEIAARHGKGEAMLRSGSQNTAAHLKNGSGDGVRNSGDSGRPSAQSQRPSRTATPEPSDTASDEHTLHRLTGVSADSTWLVQQVLATFASLILPVLTADGPELDADLQSTLEETLQHSLSFTHTLQRSAQRTIVSIFKVRCAEPLKLVRSVSTQYRSGVPAPGGGPEKNGEASYFVPQILRPLKVYFGIERGATSAKPATRLDAALKTQLVRDVVDDVAERYASILLKQNQNFASIQRMKAGASGFMGLGSSLFSSSSAGSKEDEAAARMKTQMERDIKALRAEVADFDSVGVRIEVEELDSWKRLQAAAAGATEEGTL